MTLDFGEPDLEVNEADPQALSPSLRRRSVFVIGKHRLWIDMCDWEVFQDAGKAGDVSGDQLGFSMDKFSSTYRS